MHVRFLLDAARIEKIDNQARQHLFTEMDMLPGLSTSETAKRVMHHLQQSITGATIVDEFGQKALSILRSKSPRVDLRPLSDREELVQRLLQSRQAVLRGMNEDAELAGEEEDPLKEPAAKSEQAQASSDVHSPPEVDIVREYVDEQVAGRIVWYTKSAGAPKGRSAYSIEKVAGLATCIKRPISTSRCRGKSAIFQR